MKSCPIFDEGTVASLRTLPTRVAALEQWQQDERVADAVRDERDKVILKRLDEVKTSVEQANTNYKNDKAAIIKFLVVPLYGAVASAFVVWLLSGGLGAIK